MIFFPHNHNEIVYRDFSVFQLVSNHCFSIWIIDLIFESNHSSLIPNMAKQNTFTLNWFETLNRHRQHRLINARQLGTVLDQQSQSTHRRLQLLHGRLQRPAHSDRHHQLRRQPLRRQPAPPARLRHAQRYHRTVWPKLLMIK